MDQSLYTLDEDGHLVKCFSHEEWVAWMLHEPHRFLIRTHIGRHVIVSTVFLGHEDENGCLYETTILGGELDGLTMATMSREGAQTIHDELTTKAKKAAK